jgi:hypothetical protein
VEKTTSRHQKRVRDLRHILPYSRFRIPKLLDLKGTQCAESIVQTHTFFRMAVPGQFSKPEENSFFGTFYFLIEAFVIEFEKSSLVEFFPFAHFVPVVSTNSDMALTDARDLNISDIAPTAVKHGPPSIESSQEQPRPGFASSTDNIVSLISSALEPFITYPSTPAF